MLTGTGAEARVVTLGSGWLGRASAATPHFDPARGIDFKGVVKDFARNTEIYGEGQAPDYIYKVISGTVRSYKILKSGRRQITEFYMAGDIFGFEAGEARHLSAEPTVDATVLVIKRSAMAELAGSDVNSANQLLTLMAHDLRRRHDHLVLLGCMSAKKRVVAFLLFMAERLASGNDLVLPMSRQDIADYLGLTIETVSRVLSQLDERAIIKLSAFRRVSLRNPAALCQLLN